MAEIGAYEAKTHLPNLLQRVAKGERITVTTHGIMVARLVPVAGQPDTKDAIRELRSFRKGCILDSLSVRQMIEEGRR
jgi:prevent-host-death family protein